MENNNNEQSLWSQIGSLFVSRRPKRSIRDCLAGIFSNASTSAETQPVVSEQNNTAERTSSFKSQDGLSCSQTFESCRDCTLSDEVEINESNNSKNSEEQICTACEDKNNIKCKFDKTVYQESWDETKTKFNVAFSDNSKINFTTESRSIDEKYYQTDIFVHQPLIHGNRQNFVDISTLYFGNSILIRAPIRRNNELTKNFNSAQSDHDESTGSEQFQKALTSPVNSTASSSVWEDALDTHGEIPTSAPLQSMSPSLSSNLFTKFSVSSHYWPSRITDLQDKTKSSTFTGNVYGPSHKGQNERNVTRKALENETSKTIIPNITQRPNQLEIRHKKGINEKTTDSAIPANCEASSTCSNNISKLTKPSNHEFFLNKNKSLNNNRNVKLDIAKSKENINKDM